VDYQNDLFAHVFALSNHGDRWISGLGGLSITNGKITISTLIAANVIACENKISRAGPSLYSSRYPQARALPGNRIMSERHPIARDAGDQ
jgi:hypothetical protein